MDTTNEDRAGWRIEDVDEGFCRIVYRKGETRVCLQDEIAHVACYTLTDWDEPCNSIVIKPSAFSLFELPAGDSPLQTKVREFLEDGLRRAATVKRT